MEAPDMRLVDKTRTKGFFPTYYGNSYGVHDEGIFALPMRQRGLFLAHYPAESGQSVASSANGLMSGLNSKGDHHTITDEKKCFWSGA